MDDDVAKLTTDLGAVNTIQIKVKEDISSI